MTDHDGTRRPRLPRPRLRRPRLRRPGRTPMGMVMVCLLLLAVLATTSTVSMVSTVSTGVSSAAFTVTAPGPVLRARIGRIMPPTGLTVAATCAATTPTVEALVRIDAGPHKRTVAVPDAAQPGDAVYVSLLGVGERTPSPTDGWTFFALARSGDGYQVSWRRTAQRGDVAYDVPADVGGVLFVVRDAGSGPSVNQFQVDNAGRNDIEMPTMSGAANGLLVTVWASQAANATFDPVRDMTRIFDYASSSPAASLAVDKQPLTKPGQTGERRTQVWRSPKKPETAPRSGLALVFTGSGGGKPVVRLTWKAGMTGATGYEVEVKRDTGGSSTYPTPSMSWTDPAPTSGRTTYRVRTIFHTWRSGPSDEETVTLCS